MFSVIFPGQGSQLVGMGKDLHAKYSLVQDLFNEADETLGFSLSNLIFRLTIYRFSKIIRNIIYKSYTHRF